MVGVELLLGPIKLVVNYNILNASFFIKYMSYWIVNNRIDFNLRVLHLIVHLQN